MTTQIFVNVPVKDLDRSVEFFTKLGYTFNPQFTDENATCMVVSDTIFFMLLVEPFFQTFTDKKIADASTHVEAILGLSAESKDAVDEHVDKAIAAGAIEPRPAQELGFMYSRSYQDLDGHLWEIIWMDPATLEG
ncbi:MAG TPA: VOC family protein [Terrimesophilobacter sp.]|uniref:VOC family protein n=1 Tax=Terrimesophilobacter sp. TaxID=2906435 RepID=UPI002F95A260